MLRFIKTFKDLRILNHWSFNYQKKIYKKFRNQKMYNLSVRQFNFIKIFIKIYKLNYYTTIPNNKQKMLQ